MDSRNKIFMITPGGSGTNWLHHLFTKQYLSGGHWWFNPHQRFPSLPKGARLLYMMAHPVNIILSLGRRGLLDIPHHVENIQGDLVTFRNSLEIMKGIDGYVRTGVNVFRFAEHALGWYNYAKNNNIPYLFTRYEDLPKRWEEIQEFVGKRVDLGWVERESNYETQQHSAKIEKMHKDDISLYEAFYNVFK